ncbi:hypothetical protein NVP2275O_225 [Vibrio phage 2.275.O._10N.286.54.E11]|nr:hypothetical protein NVP2275O_225 [Vibrio phage 2.275.O._10N.286.54.E11]
MSEFTIQETQKAVVRSMTPELKTRPSSMMEGYTIFEFRAGSHWTVSRVHAIIEEFEIEFLELECKLNVFSFQTKQGDELLAHFTLLGLL